MKFPSLLQIPLFVQIQPNDMVLVLVFQVTPDMAQQKVALMIYIYI